MPFTEYQQRIIDYYRDTEHAYQDSWDLDRSLAIHYGYRDEKATRFSDSLIRMNEVMMREAGIGPGDHVLDAGCGVGGSSIYLARTAGCRVTGISLSERQVQQARVHAAKQGLQDRTRFEVMDYSSTPFPDASFDVVWGCESICYAESKAAFIREAFRLLKPGGRLIVADGFVTSPAHNDHPLIRQWLDGWEVNYLETPGQFGAHMRETGFSGIRYRDITPHTRPSSVRLYRIYFLARLYLAWRKLSFRPAPTAMQVRNIHACKYQYLALKKGLWEYGILCGTRP